MHGNTWQLSQNERQKPEGKAKRNLRREMSFLGFGVRGDVTSNKGGKLRLKRNQQIWNLRKVNRRNTFLPGWLTISASCEQAYGSWLIRKQALAPKKISTTKIYNTGICIENEVGGEGED